MAAPKLKPCPFKPITPVDDADKFTIKISGGSYRVWCVECWAEGPSGRTKAEAIKRWNDRLAEETL